MANPGGHPAGKGWDDERQPFTALAENVYDERRNSVQAGRSN